MKRIFLYFLLTLGSIWLGLKIYQQPGYVLIFYRHWALETTTWFMVLLLLVSFLILHLLFNLLQNTAYLPDRVQQWWQTRQQRKAIKSLNEGYLNLLRGNWKKAEKYLVKSGENKDLSFISYMIAAQVAEKQQAGGKRDQYLIFAKRQATENSYLADAMQAKFDIRSNKPEEALTLLRRLRKEHPKDSYVIRLLAETYIMLRDWHQLQTLLKDIKKYQAFDEQHYMAIEKETYLNSFKDHYFADFSQVQTLWNKTPRHLRHDPDILVAYATHLNRWNQSDEAEELIRKDLKKSFDKRLMEYYVTTRSKQPAKQLELGEKYLKEHEQDPASLRAMGVLCLRNRLWGQAKEYLERSLKLEPVPEAYSALGFVHEKLGENEKALNYYRKGLKSTINNNSFH